MREFKFKGRVTGDRISGRVTGTTSASTTAIGSILAFLVPWWILVIIANAVMDEGSLLVALLFPVLLVLLIPYGIFLLIGALLG